MIDSPPPVPAIDEAPVEARPRSRRQLQGRQERLQRHRKMAMYVLFAGSTVLMVNALVGENGYLATIRARRENVALANSLATLRLENQALRERARRLKDDPAALEEEARRDLGLVKPGETLVIIHNARPAAAASVPR